MGRSRYSSMPRTSAVPSGRTSPGASSSVGHAHGEREGHDVIVVFESDRSADDAIVALASTHRGALWVASSDRELRRRVAPYADRLIGGGSFARSV